jgi:hydroxymethylpyrimidine/phosphomethylpyrimidine kinase
MVSERICVLSIGGFDPSGGAGVLADIKTFEANKVYGMAAVSAFTFQNDAEFVGVQWLDANEILKQIFILQRRFRFDFIKIGLIKDLETLETIIAVLKSNTPEVCLIWDPIIKASAGFEFHKKFDASDLYPILKKIYLLTPNTNEVKFLTGKYDEMEAAKKISVYCNVLLKGGHSETAPGVDFLLTENVIIRIDPTEKKTHPKHGSGCVLSAAATAELAKGNDLISSCHNAKKYTEKFLVSNLFLLGTHDVS